MRAKTLPDDLTSYDFLKAFAIILTVADHAGYYFYPDELWVRALGRLCVPIWFFLIGYAQSRDLGPRMWVALALLLGTNMLAGMSLMPFTIIVTFILIRLSIDRIAQFMLASPEIFWAVAVLLSFLAFPTAFFSEYGTSGLLFALTGWMARRESDQTRNLMALAAIVFVMVQQVIFIFPEPLFMAMSAGLIFIIGILCFFKPQTYPVLKARLPQPVSGFIQFLGRNTLEIYALHLILFKLLGIVFQPGRFVLFDWKIFSVTGI